jgi:hypothetical protein
MILAQRVLAMLARRLLRCERVINRQLAVFLEASKLLPKNGRGETEITPSQIECVVML